MKRTLIVVLALLAARAASGENRFGRPVVEVKDKELYTFIKRDEVKYPTLSNEKETVSCLVYRGTRHYYVEINVVNKTTEPIVLHPDFINFDKPGFTLDQVETMAVAREEAASSSARFTPTAPTYVPPTYKTNIDATATTYGNQSTVSGTATTTADNSGQAGANLGNAIGNAIAARRFYKAQQADVALSRFLAEHAMANADITILPGQSRILVATYDQLKRKKKPFDITVQIEGNGFRFSYKE